MKTPHYLKQLEQMDDCDIEGLIELSRAIEADKAGLVLDNRANFSELISEKVQEAISAVRAGDCAPPKSGGNR